MAQGVTAAVARVTAGYATTILPAARSELARRRERALAIPDPLLRSQALGALAKRGNMLGAALFASLAPRARRARVVRALVAFQSAYNYLDMLSESPGADPVADGRRLHEALMVALDEGDAHGDPYAEHDRRDDGGHLAAMTEACRRELRGLPSYELVRERAREGARRIVDFQSLNLGERHGPIDGLRRWGEDRTPPGSGLAWWETAAGAGSSVGVFVLIGLAAQAGLDEGTVAAVDDAYFPWIGALHSLLDSAVDVAEDERDGQRNLLAHYPSQARAIEGVARLSAGARARAAALPRGALHEALLAALTGHYLSSPRAATPRGRAIADSVVGAGGPLAGAAVKAMRACRRVPGLVPAA